MSLRERLASGSFAVTAEISPPRGASTDPITRTAGLLRGWVDAVNVTDNQGSNVRLASWAGSLAVLAAGLEPVMQMTCRDRNRIALQSDLLGAAALGIRTILVMTGDHPTSGDHPGAKPVFDLDSIQLLWTLRTMRDQAVLLSGRTLDPAPDCFLGAVENPFAPPVDLRIRRAMKKAMAGARFLQLQIGYRPERLESFMREAVLSGLVQRAALLPTICLLPGASGLRFMDERVPGIAVPHAVIARVESASDQREAAYQLALEQARHALSLPGVAGLHFISFRKDAGIAKLCERLGIPPRAEREQHGYRHPLTV